MELSRCQTDGAYLTDATGTVREVREANGAYEVVLDSTIFYAEGGGQPADRGTLGGLDVLDVQRDAPGAIVHRVASAPQVGQEVELRVDWSRRFDFMQQHTAQHLITAIADDEFELTTTSFHLGEEYSAIELDAESIGPKTLAQLEDRVNEEIRRAVAVDFRFVERDEVSADSVRSRKLPEDIGEAVRLVEIQGLDLNTCGGTHVGSTAELQVIKFIGTEAARGGTRLSYLAGERARRWMENELARHEQINEILSCGPDDYLHTISKLIDDAKTAQRELRSAREELSARLGRALARQNGRFVAAHRSERDFKFLEAVAVAALDVDGTDVVFLTASESPSGEGVFLLAASAEFVDAHGDDVAEMLDGRGGGRPGRYQGKAGAIQGREEVIDFLRDKLTTE
ncbi:MAG: alanyl-tRNA editing protein [Myxococcota bacterium]